MTIPFTVLLFLAVVLGCAIGAGLLLACFVWIDPFDW